MPQMKPSEIHYTQASIYERFGGGCHKDQFVKDALQKVLQRHLAVNDFPTIQVVKKYGKFWSLDNRRLYIFKEAEKKGICMYVNVSQVGGHYYWKKRFTTTNGGTSVEFRKTGAGMRCEFCFKHVMTPDDLYFHKQMSRHKETCKSCGSKFDCPADLEEHKFQSCCNKENIRTEVFSFTPTTSVQGTNNFRKEQQRTINDGRDLEIERDEVRALSNLMGRFGLRMRDEEKKTVHSAEQMQKIGCRTSSFSISPPSRLGASNLREHDTFLEEQSAKLVHQEQEEKRKTTEKRASFTPMFGNMNRTTKRPVSSSDHLSTDNEAREQQEIPITKQKTRISRRFQMTSSPYYSNQNGMMSVTEYLRNKKISNFGERNSLNTDVHLFRPMPNHDDSPDEQTDNNSSDWSIKGERNSTAIKSPVLTYFTGHQQTSVSENNVSQSYSSVSEYLRRMRSQRGVAFYENKRTGQEKTTRTRLF